jgi:hypothetical protein|tara:strand:+ start:95 stop:319 length:225 start_codon:yes stop_codon:yes gene_type:complete
MATQTNDQWIEDGDYSIENHGSVFLVFPQNEDAKENLINNVSNEVQFLGDAMAVEPRFITHLVEIFNNEGWRVC